MNFTVYTIFLMIPNKTCFFKCIDFASSIAAAGVFFSVASLFMAFVFLGIKRLCTFY